MRNLISIILFLFLIVTSKGQGLFINDSSTVFINENSSMFSGSQSRLNGSFKNNGNFEFAGDLFAESNVSLGNIILSGNNDQTITGDSLVIGKLRLVKQGRLIFNSRRVEVRDTFDVQSGLFENEENESVAFSGHVTEGSNVGHVEGRLIRLSTGNPMIFPLGINGNYNEVVIENVPAGQIVIVDCRIPSGNTKELPRNIVDIADEVEWQIRTTGDSIPVKLEIFFNGVNLQNESGINADGFTPAIAYTRENDTTYFALDSEQVSDPNSRSSGEITANEDIYISNRTTFLNVALVPSIAETVVYVPTAFNPNGFYEENRTFRAFFASPERTVSAVQVVIYDSFRNEIFSYTEQGEDLDLANSAWDGTRSNGQQAEEGIYYYIIKIIDDQNQVYNESNSILLTNR